MDFLIEALPFPSSPPLSERRKEAVEDTRELMGNGVTVKTRRQYARIRAVDTGVLPSTSSQRDPQPVPFILVLEPLYLGVLPASIVPVLGLLLPVILVAAFFIALRVHDHISQVAQDVEAEEARLRKEK